jgi:predicted  nucleic acid-binding Zn ribbon protein
LVFKVDRSFLLHSNEVSLRQSTNINSMNVVTLLEDTLQHFETLRWHKDELIIFGVDDLNSQSTKESSSRSWQLDNKFSMNISSTFTLKSERDLKFLNGSKSQLLGWQRWQFSRCRCFKFEASVFENKSKENL